MKPSTLRPGGVSTKIAKEQAHRRLLNAVTSFMGADRNGSHAEVRAAAIELEAAKCESQKLLYPEGIQPWIHYSKKSTVAKNLTRRRNLRHTRLLTPGIRASVK